MVDRSFLARFLACDVLEDVRQWMLALLHGAMTPSERSEERDRWFRAAASLVSGELWMRARKLHIIAAGLVGAMPAAPDTSTARGCVAAAMMLCPGRKPPSVHTRYRIACMTL